MTNMPDKDEAMETLIELADKYTHLVGIPEGSAPFALLNLGPGHPEKADRRDGIPHVVFDILWHSGWIESELQASDLTKRLYRISERGRAQVERLQTDAGDGAGI